MKTQEVEQADCYHCLLRFNFDVFFDVVVGVVVIFPLSAYLSFYGCFDIFFSLLVLVK